MKKPAGADAALDRATRALVRTLAARCRHRGPTAVLARDAAGFAAALRARGVAAVEHEIDDTGSPAAALRDGRFGSAIVFGVLERVGEETARTVLADAWALLRPGGRLLAVAPHGDGVRHADGVRAFRIRELRRMLRPLAKPALVTDQPFRWLAMSLEKPLGRARRPPRSRIDRYRVTARLCRGRVIELGCGEGHLSKMIHDRGLEVVGVDLSRVKIRHARDAYPEIPFLESDILRLELPDASFDTAILAEVLEHVPAATGDAMLRRAWRLLRAGGRLIVSVPYEDLIPHPNHVRQFDRRSLRAMLRPYGRARLVADQPLKWLLVRVEKEAG